MRRHLSILTVSGKLLESMDQILSLRIFFLLSLCRIDRMDVEKWEVGAAFLPASVGYLVGTGVFGGLGHKMGRWRAAQTGLQVIGVSLAMVS